MFNNHNLNLNRIRKQIEDNILWLKVAKSQRVFSKRKCRKSLSVRRFPFVFLQTGQKWKYLLIFSHLHHWPIFQGQSWGQF